MPGFFMSREEAWWKFILLLLPNKSKQQTHKLIALRSSFMRERKNPNDISVKTSRNSNVWFHGLKGEVVLSSLKMS